LKKKYKFFFICKIKFNIAKHLNQNTHENTWKNYLHSPGIVAILCAGLYAWLKNFLNTKTK